MRKQLLQNKTQWENDNTLNISPFSKPVKTTSAGISQMNQRQSFPGSTKCGKHSDQ